jgi:branched-chain amino acid aminotransferase
MVEGSFRPEFVWLNDALTPLSQAAVSVDDRGFLYGDGFFETLRADSGQIHFLSEHLDRLRASALTFGIPFPQLPWEERLRELLAANALERGAARVKIILTRGVASGVGLPGGFSPTLVIWASPYHAPTPAEYAAGWPVVVFPERRSTFMGRHKSLNYLFYLAARQYALDQGAKEAIIRETNGLISEGAATSVIYAHHGRYYTPAAASALPGVTVGMLTVALARREILLESTPTSLSQLFKAQGIWLANSLMGLMPVASINGKPVSLSQDLAFLREVLFSETQ